MGLSRSYPDWGVVPSSFIPADIDNAELAARLESPDAYRREGRVVALTDFSPSTGGWTPVSNAYISAAKSYVGSSSMFLNGSFGDNCLLEKWLPGFTSSKIGLSFYGQINTWYTHYLYVQIQLVSLAWYRYARIRADFDLFTLAFLNVVGGYTDFYANNDIRGLNRWINFKLIADFETRTYSRFYYNGEECFAAIAPGVPIFSVAPGAAGIGMLMQIYAQSKLNPNGIDCYIDAPIVTIHEF